MSITNKHYVTGNPILPPFSDSLSLALFGLGCFWGAEKKFWGITNIYSTAVGYAGGLTPNPTYEKVCSGTTGHSEVVRVVYDSDSTTYQDLLKIFWESHNPTQGMRQGNDIGTQYRSGIYVYSTEQKQLAEQTRHCYATKLSRENYPSEITTEIIDAPEFHYAEEYHQQYLAKNPSGYCGLGGIGISLD